MDHTDRKLKYMIIGAGGTGGAIGSHMARAGYDVTFIARGRHLEAMRKAGLRVERPDMEFTVDPVKACTMDEFAAALRQAGDEADSLRPDVIIVCVKGYSVDDTIPFIKEAAGPETVVIPILNLFGTGAVMQERLPGIIVTDGCMYVASEIRDPGYIFMNATILKVVFGLRRDQKSLDPKLRPLLVRIRDDMCESGIEAVLTDEIEMEALRKFSYVSPQGAAGLYYNVPVGGIRDNEECLEFFKGLIREVSAIADAMGFGFGEDIVPVNIAITERLAADMTTSLQRDVAAGRPSEIDGLIYEVVRMGERYGVDVPLYRKVSEEMRSKLCN